MNNDLLIKGESEPTQIASVMIDAARRLHREFPLTGSTDKTLKLYEGHYHDLLNDVDKEVVMADINDWIDAHVPVLRTKSVAR